MCRQSCATPACINRFTGLRKALISEVPSCRRGHGRMRSRDADRAGTSDWKWTIDIRASMQFVLVIAVLMGAAALLRRASQDATRRQIVKGSIQDTRIVADHAVETRWGGQATWRVDYKVAYRPVATIMRCGPTRASAAKAKQRSSSRCQNRSLSVKYGTTQRNLRNLSPSADEVPPEIPQ
jgi:hypothetical protein